MTMQSGPCFHHLFKADFVSHAIRQQKSVIGQALQSIHKYPGRAKPPCREVRVELAHAGVHPTVNIPKGEDELCLRVLRYQNIDESEMDTAGIHVQRLRGVSFTDKGSQFLTGCGAHDALLY